MRKNGLEIIMIKKMQKKKQLYKQTNNKGFTGLIVEH